MIQFGAPLPIVETKTKSDAWEVSGYASTYGNVDFGQDVVMLGAFDRWLRENRKTRLLYTHRPDKVLGIVQTMHSDNVGLKITGKISKTPLGEEVYTLIQDGAIDSFSIGYITKDSEMKDGVRLLKDLDLLEISLVAIPMNPRATVTAWKDWLSAFNVDDEFNSESKMTLAEKAAQINAAMNELLNDCQALSENGRDLNQKKRDELAALLETFSSLGDVHRKIAGMVAQPLTGKAEVRRVLYEIEQRRNRLQTILMR